NLKEGEAGRFFDDYCNWTRIAEFEEVLQHSPAAEVAADLMKSETVQVFHDHVLVKEPGTTKPTPWHQDGPYYFVEGLQNVSFWSPMDPVTEASLRCVAGSHAWEKQVLPTRWLAETNFYPDSEAYMPVPDPDAEGMEIREWDMEPGDAVAFSFHILHGARGNTTNRRRRAFSLRLLGDDARYVERPGRTSPPFPGHNMMPGQRLREDWFPVIFRR
ncbi:MAG: phytanoyl-CoA dioxygenase family protein, partial [Pseudomonadota bacterium]